MNYRICTHTWSFAEAEEALKRGMNQVVLNCAQAAASYGKTGDYLAGANIYAFEKVTEAIWRQGYI